MKKAILIIVAMFTMWTVANAQSANKIKEINMEQFIGLFDTSTGAVSKPAVFDFNATWCGPCRKLAPILEELAKEYAGKVDFYSIDVDKNKELAKMLEIQSIPYVLLFAPGAEEPEEMIGLSSKEEIKALIEKIAKH